MYINERFEVIRFTSSRWELWIRNDVNSTGTMIFYVAFRSQNHEVSKKILVEQKTTILL